MSGRGGGPVSSRFLTVAADRLPGWVSRYTAAREQAVTAFPTPTGLELVGVDGSLAKLDLLDAAGWVVPGQAPGGLEGSGGRDAGPPGGSGTGAAGGSGAGAAGGSGAGAAGGSGAGAAGGSGAGAAEGSPVGSTPGPALDALVERLAAEALRPRVLLVALVRRGGWTVGVVSSGRVLTGATGRRYVQGGTAAGGWSQQRFARRRQGQSAKLADDATAALGRVLSQSDEEPTALVWGGDRALLDSVVAGTAVSSLPRLGPLEVGEPRRVDLEQSAERVLGLRVTVFDAPA